MSTGEVVVRTLIGGIAGAAVMAAVIPYLRRVRHDRARFLAEQGSARPSNDGKNAGPAGDPLEFVAGAKCESPGPSRSPRSRAEAAGRKVAATGEVFARAGASIPAGDRVMVWRQLIDESQPFRVAYWWATSFGKFFAAGALLFIASLIAILGDYSREILVATLAASAILLGLPAVKLHRIVWQALNLSAGVYVVALDGARDAEE